MNREKGKREAKPFNKGEEPLSPAARLQPRGLVPLGGGDFEKARLEDKPVFVSIGYSTCHWCHFAK